MFYHSFIFLFFPPFFLFLLQILPCFSIRTKKFPPRGGGVARIYIPGLDNGTKQRSSCGYLVDASENNGDNSWSNGCPQLPGVALEAAGGGPLKRKRLGWQNNVKHQNTIKISQNTVLKHRSRCFICVLVMPSALLPI